MRHHRSGCCGRHAGHSRRHGLADGDKDLCIDVRVACAESHEVGFKEAIAAAEKIKTDKYAREVAGISQSAFLPFVVGSHGGLGTCAKQVWALLVQRAKLVAARDWRQSWSAMTDQQVWLRRLSVAIAKQEARGDCYPCARPACYPPGCYGCGCVR